MSRRMKLSMAEEIAFLEARDRANCERGRDEREARLDAPVPRRELLAAIRNAEREFSASGYEARDLVADAFRKLYGELE
jgi:hypothetical protein